MAESVYLLTWARKATSVADGKYLFSLFIHVIFWSRQQSHFIHCLHVINPVAVRVSLFRLRDAICSCHAYHSFTMRGGWTLWPVWAMSCKCCELWAMKIHTRTQTHSHTHTHTALTQALTQTHISTTCAASNEVPWKTYKTNVQCKNPKLMPESHVESCKCRWRRSPICQEDS